MARRNSRGFSLVELIVSLGLLGVVMTSVTGVVLSMQRGYIGQREVARAEDALRVGEMTLVTVLRMAGATPMDITASPAPGIDPNPLGAASFNNLRVISDHNPADMDANDLLEDVLVWVQADTMYVRWQAGQTAAPIAYPVRSLAFEYDSSGTPLTVAADIARAANRVKVTLTAPRHPNTGALIRRETWIHLRNRP